MFILFFNIKTLVLLLVCCFINVFAIRNIVKHEQMKMNFLRDFILNGENVRYDIYSCWPRGMMREFAMVATQRQISFPSMDKFLHDDTQDHLLIKILDLKCIDADIILSKANLTNHFSAPNKWLIISEKESRLGKNYIETLNFYLDSDIILAEVADSDKIILTQPYKYNDQGSKIVYEIYGFWTSKSGIVDERSNKILSVRRKNLHQTLINSSYVVTFPETPQRLNDQRYFHQDSITKFSVPFTQVVADYLNTSLNWTPVDGWGVKLKNGSWTGLMGRLLKREDHLSGNGLLMLQEREPYVKFLARSAPTTVGLIFRKPPLSYVTNILRLSLQKWVWFSLFLLMLLSIFIIRFSFTQEIKQTQRESKNRESAVVVPLDNEWSSVTMFIMGGLCQQGAEVEPRGISGRILTLFIYLAMMFIYTSYSANIVALLQSSSDTINSLKDVTKSRLEAGVINLEYGKNMFLNTNDPDRQEFFQKKIGPNGFYSTAEGIERVRKGLFAFVNELAPCYYYIGKTFLENERCDLKELYNLGLSQSLFAAVPRRSPYAEIIKIAVMKVEEYGIQQKIFYEIYTQRPQCQNAGANFVSVGLIDLYWAFVIWCMGVLLATVVIVLEIAFKKLYVNQRKQQIYTLK